MATDPRPLQDVEKLFMMALDAGAEYIRIGDFEVRLPSGPVHMATTGLAASVAPALAGKVTRDGQPVQRDPLERAPNPYDRLFPNGKPTLKSLQLPVAEDVEG